jgi:hypothetical protein
MLEQPRVRRLLLLLIIGEIIMTIVAILSGVSTEGVMYIIIFFGGMWIIYSLVSVWVDSWTKG